MLSFIDMLKQLGPLTVIVLFWFSVIAMKEIVEVYRWFVKLLESWRDKKNGVEKKDESNEARIQKLETTIADMSGKIDKIIDIIAEQQKDNDLVTVANSRATLNALAEQISSKGFMTETEYDTFMDLSDIYLRKNGNHSMKDKVIPYIKSLPVR